MKEFQLSNVIASRERGTCRLKPDEKNFLRNLRCLSTSASRQGTNEFLSSTISAKKSGIHIIFVNNEVRILM